MRSYPNTSTRHLRLSVQVVVILLGSSILLFAAPHHQAPIPLWGKIGFKEAAWDRVSQAIHGSPNPELLLSEKKWGIQTVKHVIS